MIQASRSTSFATFGRHCSRGVIFHPGCQNSVSRWITGSPVLAASLRVNVLLPAPEMPITRTLCMTRDQRWAASRAALRRAKSSPAW